MSTYLFLNKQIICFVVSLQGFNESRRKVIQYVDYVNAGEVVNGHGTHVCGTVAGRKSEDGVMNSNGFVDGVAKDAKLAFFDVGEDDAKGMNVSFFFASDMRSICEAAHINIILFLPPSLS